jgi:Peptidase family C25/Secretion system C-terminal sorting domain
MKNIFLTTCIVLAICPSLFTQNSILSSGTFYKMSTATEGIYKISYSDLQAYGINPSTIDPRNLKIYGNGGGMLEQLNSAPKINDLQEIAIKVIGESDGVFNTSDYILFYSQAPDKWNYDYSLQTFAHEKNLYSNNTFYFITVGATNGKRIVAQNSSVSTITNISNKYDNLIFHEMDSLNLIQSGRIWFGEVFDTQLSYTFNYTLSNLDLSATATINTNVAGRSPITSQVDINSNGNISTISMSLVNMTSYTARYANIGSSSMNFTPSSTTIPITFTYNQPDTSSIAWLDYFELITRNNLSKNGNQLLFRDKMTIGNGNITQFQINNTLPSDFVWEITKHNNVAEQNKIFNTGTTQFSLSTDSLRKFIVFDLTNLLSPTYVNQINNQNIHGITAADMIIVTHPNFVAEANNLASFHLTNDGILAEVVTTEEIYNEFSSGSQDITAINDFMEYLYNQPSSPLKYLLLFGDGSYDYKNRIVPNTNFVPTYQSENSIDIIGSLTSDDFYGLLDANEGSWVSTNELMDISIGRLPVKTLQEATDVVNKIINYKTNTSSFDDWRKTITFIADDEDFNTHMAQADALASMVENQCSFITEKIYIDKYPQVINGTQESYPEAEQKIVRSFRRGSLIMNFTGHGGSGQFASENILDTNSLDTLNNSNYPLMITATSENSRYDNPAFTSFGEQFLLKPNAGSIASYTTTRLVFSSPNFTLNQAVYNTIFNKVSGKYKTLGETFMEVKNLNASNSNNRNFTLLGDPALTLNFPEFVVNAVHPDTLQSASSNTITGQIEDDNGILQNWFTGSLIVFIQGSKDTIITLGNNGGTPFTFLDRRDSIYYDTIPIVNGLFNYGINLSNLPIHMIGNAKINYYGFNGATDASGCNDSIYINDILTSIENVSEDEIIGNIYPNPSSNTVTITLDDNDDYTFKLYNNIGQIIIENKKITNGTYSFSVRNLTNGIYYYRITGNSESKSGKLVVQH